MPPPRLPDAVLCDMDGLLLDTETLSKIAFDAVAGRHGFRDDGAVYNQLVGLGRAAQREIFERSLPDSIDLGAFDEEWREDFLVRLGAGVPVKPHAEAMLAWLGGRGVPVALATSTARAKTEMILGRCGLAGHFGAVVCGDEVGRGKPAPDIYLEAAARLGVEPASAIALEDSPSGVRAAHAAGARVIQVVDLLPPDDDLLALGHEVVHSLAELAGHLGWDFAR